VHLKVHKRDNFLGADFELVPCGAVAVIVYPFDPFACGNSELQATLRMSAIYILN
jgi:hypothetical protein